jgi:DNA-binding phage protein
MALTKSFKQTIKEMMHNDPEFATILFQEAIQAMLEGDLDTGKSVLRDYINATVGFEAVAKGTGTPAKSLHRMLSSTGNPQAKKLFAVLAYLENQSGMHVQVQAYRKQDPQN